MPPTPKVKQLQKGNVQNKAILKALEDSKKCPVVYLKQKLDILLILLKASKTCHFGHLFLVIFSFFCVEKYMSETTRF